MSRYKGRAKPTLIERDFPHHVEVLVPLGGLGTRLDAMHEWHALEALKQGAGAVGAMRVARLHSLALADRATADLFKKEFG